MPSIRQIWIWLFLPLPAPAPAQENYTTWCRSLAPELRDFSADPDGDTLANGLEFVLGTAPLQPEGEAPTWLGAEIVADKHHATLSFDLSSPSFADVSLRVEACSDAISWASLAHLPAGASWRGSAVPTITPAAQGTSVRITVRDTARFAPAQPRFLRLVAWYDPNPDRDQDGIPDGYELANDLDPETNDANLDRDADGLTNAQEFAANLRANLADTDGDGLLDGFELASGHHPHQPTSAAIKHPNTALVILLPTPAL